MERAFNHVEDQNIKAAASGNVGKIDVSDRVMARIAELDGRSRRSASRIARRGSTAAFAAIALLLVVSASAYAAKAYIQLQNDKGEVKVQYQAPSAEASPPPTAEQAIAQSAAATAKPGELIAYYVKGQKGAPELRFESKEHRIASYADFQAEIERTSSPPLPDTLFGYSFAYGTVAPNPPSTDADKKSELYRSTLQELTRQASKDSSGRKLFKKAIPWSKASQVAAIYKKGGSRIDVYAQLMHGGKMYVEQEKENAASTVDVNGTKLIYNDVKKGEAQYGYVNWYDEKQDVYYTLSSPIGHQLTKEEFLQTAKELLQ